jgi:AhpC/TSA family
VKDDTFTIIDAGHVTQTGDDEGVHLVERGEAAGRPVALDRDERAAYLGVSARERAARLASLEAPDFTLPDADGRLSSLSDHRGKKVFLVAYASW